MLYTLLAILRLRAIAGNMTRPAYAPEPAQAPAAPRGIGGAFAAEWWRVLTNRGAFILLVLGPLVYGVYYPQPYLNQILRKIPIAVVDNDLSELSRNIVQTLDASGAVKVAVRAETWPTRAPRSTAARPSPWSASARDGARRAQGPHRPSADLCRCDLPVHLPNDWQRHRGRHQHAVVRARRGRRAHGRQPGQGGARVGEPADILLQPIFNPVGGYASYIVPAAFVLILQQMLLIGASMLTVVALAQRGGGAFASVLGRGIAHLTIFLPALALYFIVLPRVYGFSALGHPLQLLALAVLFTLATSFMGQAVGAWFTHPETPTLIFLGTSLPQLFDRVLLAARGNPHAAACRRHHLSLRSRDRRHRAHRSTGREPVGGGARLAGPLASPSPISRSQCSFLVKWRRRHG